MTTRFERMGVCRDEGRRPRVARQKNESKADRIGAIRQTGRHLERYKFVWGASANKVARLSRIFAQPFPYERV
jgi:hypothetical protein